MIWQNGCRLPLTELLGYTCTSGAPRGPAARTCPRKHCPFEQAGSNINQQSIDQWLGAISISSCSGLISGSIDQQWMQVVVDPKVRTSPRRGYFQITKAHDGLSTRNTEHNGKIQEGFSCGRPGLQPSILLKCCWQTKRQDCTFTSCSVDF